MCLAIASLPGGSLSVQQYEGAAAPAAPVLFKTAPQRWPQIVKSVWVGCLAMQPRALASAHANTSAHCTLAEVHTLKMLQVQCEGGDGGK